MQPISITAASAEEAVAQIRAQLGPEAVVVNVRPLPANGLARLWQKPMIEVLAYRPEPAPAEHAPISEALAEFRQQLHEIKQQVESRESRLEKAAPDPREIRTEALFSETSELEHGRWRVGTVLQKTGLLPLHAQHVLDQLRAQHGEVPPTSLGEEIALTRAM